jgi:Oligosaccharide biosynthesis protein Alg14 like.
VKSTGVTRRPAKVLMIASAGGHWQQLMLLRDAVEGQDAQYATTLPGLAEQWQIEGAHLIPDCNRNSWLAVLHSTAMIMLMLLRVRPAVIVTTGALPGFLALVLGRKLGAKTVWIDSVANAEEMSLAGLKAKKYADLWLSQWPNVAQASGAEFAGSVL